MRPITVTDIDLMVELDSDPAVMRYITGGTPTSPEEAAATVHRSLAHRWVAHERASNGFIGWFGLRPSGDNEAELGYRLRQASWGNGYATEGARHLIERGFTNQRLHRIWGQTMTVNTASRRVMEAVGMQYVRTFHIDWPEVIEGSEQGDVEYEILAPY